MNAITELLSIDLETTGLRIDSDRIVQYSFILLDEELREMQRWEGLVNPGLQIPKEATAIHGIDDAAVREKPFFASHAPQLRELIKPATILAGYNARRFDVPLLHYEFLRSGLKGISVGQKVIDTLRIEQRVNSHRLEAAYFRYTGRRLDQAHGAPADNSAHVEVLRRQRILHREILPATLDELAFPEEDENLDWGGYFVRDRDGVVRFGFGKNRGKPAASDPDYLQWMLSSNFGDDVKQVIRSQLRAAMPSGRARL